MVGAQNDPVGADGLDESAQEPGVVDDRVVVEAPQRLLRRLAQSRARERASGWNECAWRSRPRSVRIAPPP
jgi:hypothetical protein